MTTDDIDNIPALQLRQWWPQTTTMTSRHYNCVSDDHRRRQWHNVLVFNQLTLDYIYSMFCIQSYYNCCRRLVKLDDNNGSIKRAFIALRNSMFSLKDLGMLQTMLITSQRCQHINVSHYRDDGRHLHIRPTKTTTGTKGLHYMVTCMWQQAAILTQCHIMHSARRDLSIRPALVHSGHDRPWHQ